MREQTVEQQLDDDDAPLALLRDDPPRHGETALAHQSAPGAVRPVDRLSLVHRRRREPPGLASRIDLAPQGAGGVAHPAGRRGALEPDRQRLPSVRGAAQGDTAAVVGEDAERSDPGTGVEPGQRQLAQVGAAAVRLHQAEARELAQRNEVFGGRLVEPFEVGFDFECRAVDELSRERLDGPARAPEGGAEHAGGENENDDSLSEEESMAEGLSARHGRSGQMEAYTSGTPPRLVRSRRASGRREPRAQRPTRAIARSGAPEPPPILIGSATTQKSRAGRASRFRTFSRPGISRAAAIRCTSKSLDGP